LVVLPQFDILIVGGGFSGTVLAVHLLRESSTLSIAVMDRGSLPGRGLAYGSPHRFHLLNVPACEMSAFPDVPHDFLGWARIHHDAGLQERSFPPRSVYGAYVGDVLEKAKSEHGRDRFHWLRNEALSLRLRGNEVAVQTKHGPEVLARVVVMATGNFPPANPHVAGLEAPGDAYFKFPWSPAAIENIDPTRAILLLGSGLTSVDLIMGLKAKGFRGVIYVLSRKGLFPRARRYVRPLEPWPVFWNTQSPRTVRGLLRLVRGQVDEAAQKGIDWRAVIDSLRPVTQRIWQSLSLKERKRFVRHVRVYWDVHRHRAAPEISDLLDDMRAEGQVQLYTGVLTKYRARHNGAEITYLDSKSRSERKLQVSRVINCTGSETDCRRLDDSLVVSLLAQGLARPDPLFLGLEVDANGRLLSYKGVPSHSLFAIGPPRKGVLWETTTVADIRQQAVEAAHTLARQLEGDSRRRSRGLKRAI
jgi:uncharacterized NAD(P)/FAD-binding protein YdhS